MGMIGYVGMLDGKPVQATRHAAGRFMQRNMDASCVWYKDRKMLFDHISEVLSGSADTIPPDYPERSRRHGNRPRFLYNEDEDLRFVMVDAGDKWRIVTIERPYET